MCISYSDQEIPSPKSIDKFNFIDLFQFRISTRQGLRGPFGELLMEEMAKPSSLKSIQPAQFPALVSVGSGALCTVTTYTSDASCHTTLAQVNIFKNHLIIIS